MQCMSIQRDSGEINVCVDNHDDFIAKIGLLTSIFHDIDIYCTCFCIVGDFNSNINCDTSVSSKYIHTFCSDNNVLFSSKNMLPSNSFTYISES